MPEALSLLFSHLDQQLPQPSHADHSSVCFIIDQNRQPQALERLYEQAGTFTFEFLLSKTEFAHLARSGPLWISTPRGSLHERIGQALCLDNAGGIAITCHEPHAALQHARWLLKVDDGSGGQSLATYYQPELWAAMALYCGNPSLRSHLLGPWLSAACSAPRHILHCQDWLGWQADPTAAGEALTGYFALPPQTPQAYRLLRWLYWLDRHHQHIEPRPAQAQLATLIGNLDYLHNSGITQNRHMLKLSALINGPAIAKQPELATIASCGDAPHLIVERLLAATR